MVWWLQTTNDGVPLGPLLVLVGLVGWCVGLLISTWFSKKKQVVLYYQKSCFSHFHMLVYWLALFGFVICKCHQISLERSKSAGHVVVFNFDQVKSRRAKRITSGQIKEKTRSSFFSSTLMSVPVLPKAGSAKYCYLQLLISWRKELRWLARQLPKSFRIKIRTGKMENLLWMQSHSILPPPLAQPVVLFFPKLVRQVPAKWYSRSCMVGI